MIKKEIILNDGRKYIVGFEEVGDSFKCIKCHILKKTLFFFHNSIYFKSHGKGLYPNYQQIALWTILDYEKECEQQESLLLTDWS